MVGRIKRLYKYYIEEGWDACLVAGIIGNMFDEGTYGLLQKGMDWEQFKDEKGKAICYAGMTITNSKQAKIACEKAGGSYGIGMMQWSYSTRKANLLNFYKEQLKNEELSENEELSKNDLITAELNLIYYEFNNNSELVSTCQKYIQSSNSAGDNIIYAVAIICKDYENAKASEIIDGESYKIPESEWVDAINVGADEDLPHVCKRVVAAMVAYEYFMYGVS